MDALGEDFEDEERIRIDLVWTPAFGNPNSSRDRLDNLQAENPDPRSRVWWDPSLDFSIAMAEEVGSAPPFYDRILVYAPGRTWGEGTPVDYEWLDSGNFTTEELVEEVEDDLPECPGGVRTE